VALAGARPFGGFSATLDATGTGAATFGPFGPLPASLVGAERTFAFVAVAGPGTFEFSSNPVTIPITP